MIVSTMNIQEIHAELRKDLPDFSEALRHKYKPFGSVVLKSGKYPVFRRYTITTKSRHNTFHVRLAAYRRSDWKHPAVTVYTIYSRPEGLHCVLLQPDGRQSIVFPPHFFARYRERVVGNENLRSEDLIHHFVSRTCAISFLLMPTQLQDSLVRRGIFPSDEEVKFMAFCADGILFGKRMGPVVLVKTIITPSMLFDDQMEIYLSIRDRYVKTLYESYYKGEADYLVGLMEDAGHQIPNKTP